MGRLFNILMITVCICAIGFFSYIIYTTIASPVETNRRCISRGVKACGRLYVEADRPEGQGYLKAEKDCVLEHVYRCFEKYR